MFKYFYGLIIALFLYMVGSEIYDNLNKKDGKSTRIACHKKSTTFEHIYNQKQIKDIQEAFKSGNVEIKSKFKLATYMKSDIENYITLQEVDSMIMEQITKSKIEKKRDNRLLIDYFIYENDKADPGKKTKKSKLYAGYIRLYFILKGQKIYHFQIDFMDLKSRDIKEKIACTSQSLLSL